MQLSTAGSAAVVQTQIVLKVKKVCFAAQESAVRVAAGKNGELYSIPTPTLCQEPN